MFVIAVRASEQKKNVLFPIYRTALSMESAEHLVRPVVWQPDLSTHFCISCFRPHAGARAWRGEAPRREREHAQPLSPASGGEGKRSTIAGAGAGVAAELSVHANRCVRALCSRGRARACANGAVPWRCA